MSARTRAAAVAAPLVLALLASSWLLWTRGDPARQGGYCMNATVEIAGLLQRADAPDGVGRGPLPPPDRLAAELPDVDVARFQVDTPPELQVHVDALAEGPDAVAFVAIAADYLERCRTAS